MSEEIQTIKMNRAEPAYFGGPTEADVHPDEIENWKEHGWTVAEDGDAKPKPKGRPKKNPDE
jgi:hypothetical protein